MERTDETLSTRDLASPAQEPAAEPDAPAAEAAPTHQDAHAAEAEAQRTADDADTAREDGGEPVDPAAPVASRTCSCASKILLIEKVRRSPRAQAWRPRLPIWVKSA